MSSQARRSEYLSGANGGDRRTHMEMELLRFILRTRSSEGKGSYLSENQEGNLEKGGGNGPGAGPGSTELLLLREIQVNRERSWGSCCSAAH